MPETAAEVVIDRASRSVLIVLASRDATGRGRPALQFDAAGAREIAARLLAGADVIEGEA